VDVDGFEEIAEGIRALFSGGKLPEEMADEIRAAYQKLSEDAGGTPVAARSSAPAEDLPGMSFGSGSGRHLVEKAEAKLEGSDPTNVMPARLR
jgi:phosphoenolpyruvate synthase/pyruvate phosphate dikinase